MKHSEIIVEIEKTEKQLSSLREKLKEVEPIKPENAKIGDVLEDGSIVVQTYPNHNAILVVSPRSENLPVRGGTGFHRAFEEIKGSLEAEWFVPSKEILNLAMNSVPEAFTLNKWYFTSSAYQIRVIANENRTTSTVSWIYDTQITKASYYDYGFQRLFRFIAF